MCCKSMRWRSQMLFLCVIHFYITFASGEYCYTESSCHLVKNPFSSKYLFYDVNLPEGFNLRRDVYMRLAVFVYSLQKKGMDWKLVLPPWHHLYHWRSDVGNQNFLPWGLFFDIDSMKRFAPVIEYHEFMHEVKLEHLEQIYVLQHFEEAFLQSDWDWTDRWEFKPCNQDILCTNHPCTSSNYYYENGKFYGWFWGYKNITGLSVKCVSFQGPASFLEKVLENEPSSKFVMIDHAEVVVHDVFGDSLYWKCRRSMRFAKKLVQLANEFRLLLGSNDTNDITVRPEMWEDEKMQRKAIGGPYVCAHIRRGDFLYGRKNLIPNLKYAVEQLISILKLMKLNTIFVATDASREEIETLQNLIKPSRIMQYIPGNKIRKEIKDGGVAIVDQIICSYSRYFIGTHESTFTFRIQEEREIIGFEPATTFNVFCAAPDNCFDTSRWKIMY